MSVIVMKLCVYVHKTTMARPANMVNCLCFNVVHLVYSKTCVKQPLKNRQNKGLNDNW